MQTKNAVAIAFYLGDNQNYYQAKVAALDIWDLLCNGQSHHDEICINL